MLTRREALLGAAGLLAAPVGANPVADGASASDAAPLRTLPGKKPLIQRAFRPPNFETPLPDLVPRYTGNSVFFVRYHLADVPRIDATSWRLRVRFTRATASS